MKTEIKAGLLFNVLNIIVPQMKFLSDFAVGFISGLFASLGIFFIIIGMLPDRVYNNLLYRKIIENKKTD